MDDSKFSLGDRPMPIGMAYVPMQQPTETIYREDMALIRGTIYSELDLPNPTRGKISEPPTT